MRVCAIRLIEYTRASHHKRLFVNNIHGCNVCDVMKTARDVMCDKRVEREIHVYCTCKLTEETRVEGGRGMIRAGEGQAEERICAFCGRRAMPRRGK